MTGVYCIVDVVFSFIHGWISDRFGHLVVVSVAVLCELAAVVLSWFANSLQNWLIYATGVVMAIADAGEIMPPKSTWFEPKLRDGLVSHNF